MSAAEVIAGYLSDDVKITKVKDHSAANTTDVTSDELDMAGYDAVLFLTSFGTAAANNLVTMHDSAVSGSGFAATVALKASGTSDEDVLLDVHQPVQRYVKLVGSRGTSSTLESIWAIQYRARAKAITNAISGTMATAKFTGPAAA